MRAFSILYSVVPWLRAPKAYAATGRPAPAPCLLAGVALISWGTLALQLAWSRLFAVSLWHHFAFMVVSIAFLGFGASGTFLMMAQDRMRSVTPRSLARLALAFSVACLTAYLGSRQIPFDPARLMWDRLQIVYLLACYVLSAVPFFFAGLVLALVYSRQAERVGVVYAWDLAGAGLGCLSFFWVYRHGGEQTAVLFVCLVAAAASFAFTSRGRRFNLLRVTWVGALLLMTASRPDFLQARISPYKPLMAALQYPGARLLETRWDGATRLDVIQSGAVRFAPGLSLEFGGTLPEQLGLCLDGDQLNAMTRFTGDLAPLAFAQYLPSSLVYHMRQAKDVLIMDPLGGLDVLVARYHGADRVVTTHRSGIVLDAMTGRYKEFSGDLYGGQAVAVREQARSFLPRTTETFDVVQLPLTDAMGAGSSGLYGLSEDYALTVEAFCAYLDALRPDGFLTVTQYLLPPPRQEIRLVALAREALEAQGIAEPTSHIAAVRSWGAFVLLVKKTPLQPAETERLKAFCRRLRLDPVYYPGMERGEANVFNRFAAPVYYEAVRKILDRSLKDAFLRDYLFDVSPVTDDRPFFHHYFRLVKAGPLYRAVGNKWQMFLEGGYLVYLVLLQALLAAAVLVALPLSRGRLIRKGQPGAPAGSLLYFGIIGVAFMFVEIGLVQRFMLFLARPAYALAVILFSLLVASAFGSYWTRGQTRVQTRGRPWVHIRGMGLPLAGPLFVLVYALFLQRLLMLAMGWPFWIRVAATFVFLFPLGFVMGAFFPAGVRALKRRAEKAIPWAWAINGCASVVGSALAMVIAVAQGFTTVLILAAAAYAAAACLLLFEDLAHHGNKGNA